ncbi:isocitrate dehydrogenase [NAD] [Pseudanabaena sp. lw0831]|nr:isocitrate dehydrogenase [NAD] [Pseudanabaena sp. lw0831]
MKFTYGLFLEFVRDVAKSSPEIEFEDRIVDNMRMQLMQKPELYDVLVLPNLYGDIVSDLTSGMIDGLGVAPVATMETEWLQTKPFLALHQNMRVKTRLPPRL